ncbi:type II toxin-antitoxin system RelE/ParE family toxin [Streptomyces sp. SID13666]|uniref:type II toxin-antitoxin system RelE/ParE family toxin n=1 Tax=unclassified Streptomyces TaxID=2593676 RepID=UPI0013C16638|nr:MULTISPECIES: type II toxin-antitoxin system RelE/ParE family toxin [unclassified Streptomyces]NEA56887.1 type II toxin-antitoxin system RelE/ParE family toxin [Streptomyces sp. SID13666]NEA75715.1 type II toxin-antitoxin system RelE/ParE family toxin [Streptomyces sp. SID13588]
MDASRYAVEIEPEVRLWLANLPARHYLKAEEYADLLADNASVLGEPYSRHLGGKLRELRFNLDGMPTRISYWLAPSQRVVLLTVFRKTKMREIAEVERAHRARTPCEQSHPPAAQHDEFSRQVKEGELR